MSAVTIESGSPVGPIAATGERSRLPLLVLLAFAIVAASVACAVLGALIAPHDPNQQDLLASLRGPSAAHLLGTDDLGRDVLSRTIAGARTALAGPILIALGSALIGNALGLLAGYRGGRIDATIMRWVDMMYALPPLLVAIVVAGVLGGGYLLAVAVLVILSAPYDTRVIRGATVEQRPRPYVEAARTLGVSDRRVMFRHIFPNVLPLTVANTFLNFAFAIVALAGLSFLGIGVGPGTADWGRMLSESRTLIFTNPWTALAPGLATILLAASMNVIGDWVYERFYDRGRMR